MSRQRLPFIALATLVVAGCGTGGFEYWLYPEPRLAEPEEALFVAHENHRVLSIDGEEIASSCTGEGRRPEAYQRNDVICRFHIRPGQHSVVFHPSITSRERMRLEFAALPGKVYGLTWSGCTASLDRDRHRQTCRVEVVEIEKPGRGLSSEEDDQQDQTRGFGQTAEDPFSGPGSS